MGKVGEGLALVISFVGLALAVAYLFLIWLPNFKANL
jgi:hypothetical protein